MSNKRQLRLGKYGISPKRYKELCGFCEQYPEWKKELEEIKSISAVQYTDEPKSPNFGMSDMTGNAATRRIDLAERCRLIEDTAKEAAGNGSERLVDCLIRSVCYEVPYFKLDVPYSTSSFYEYRRYFFYLLDKNRRF